MTMEVPQYVMVRQPLAEFVAEHRKEIDAVIRKLAAKPPAISLRYPLSDELREHIVIISSGVDSLYAKWRKTERPVRKGRT
jgi:hypothetical protein